METDYATVGYVNFLFGIFCAYWAQITERNPWLWFFLGLFFGPITGLVLLSKTREDRKKEISRLTLVVAVAVVYIFLAWFLLQATIAVAEGLGLPPLVARVVIVALIVGFPIVLGLASRGKFPAMQRFSDSCSRQRLSAKPGSGFRCHRCHSKGRWISRAAGCGAGDLPRWSVYLASACCRQDH